MVLLVVAALLWGPGALLGRALGLSRRWALVAAPGLTWGAVTLAAVAVPRLGLPWTATTAAASLVVLLLAAALLRRRRSGPPPPEVSRSGARGWVAAGVGCAVAAAVVVATAWRAGHPLGGTAQSWDAVYHANLTTMIAATGDSDPVRAPSALASAGWRDVDTYYPDALHALAALVVRLTGAGAASVLDVVLVLSSAVVLPVAAAALAATVVPGGPVSRPRRGTAAGVAAAVSVLPVAFPVDQWWRGVWSYGLSLTAGVLAAALVLRALQGRLGPRTPPRAAVALVGLVLLGVAGLQPAGVVLAGLLVLGWALGRLASCAAVRPPSPRLLAGLGAALAGTALLPVVVLALARWSPELGSLAAYDYTSRSGSAASVAHTAWSVLGMVRRVLPAYGYDVPAQSGQGVLAVVVVLAAAALLVLPGRGSGARWLVAVWLLLLAAAVSTVAPVGAVLTPPVAAALRAVTLFSYGAPFRLMAVVAVVSAVLVGVAVGVLVEVVAGVVAGRLAERGAAVRAVAVSLAVVLGAVVVGESLARTPVRLAAGYAPRVTGPDQIAVMDALARRLREQPLPAGATVANDPVDGSPWLYALHGVPVLFRHYSAGDVTPPARLLLDRLDDADADPAVQQALRELRVCYVYASDTRVQDAQPTAAGFADLEGVASLELVARSGSAAAYRVLVPGTPCA